MREIHRVLKPGGHYGTREADGTDVFTVPDTPQIRDCYLAYSKLLTLNGYVFLCFLALTCGEFCGLVCFSKIETKDGIEVFNSLPSPSQYLYFTNCTCNNLKK